MFADKATTVLAWVLVAALCSWGACHATTFSLVNRSDVPLWVCLADAVGLSGPVGGTCKRLGPGERLEENRPIHGVWAFPMDRSSSLATFERRVRRQAAGRDAAAVLRDRAERGGCFQRLGVEGVWRMSFAHDRRGKPLLYLGEFDPAQAFTVLQLSDMHCIDSTRTAAVPAGKPHRKRVGHAQLVGFQRQKLALCDRMCAAIRSRKSSVRAVVIPGDAVGAYGLQANFDAFLRLWMAPLQKALHPRGGHVILGIGNHDTYWGSAFEPKPTRMLRYIRKTCGDWLTAFNVGPLRFIHLGIHPASRKAQDGRLTTTTPSLSFLARELRRACDRPAVLIFHYPIHGPYGGWWSKAEKDALYATIRSARVVLIMVGHENGTGLHQFRDRCPVVRAAGFEFAELTFDPAQPDRVGIVFIDGAGRRATREPVRDAVEADVVRRH